MKKLFFIIVILLIATGISGFTYLDEDSFVFDINDLYSYEKQYKSEEIGVCSMSSVKSYMDYRMTTVKSSRQYKFLNYECTVDKKTGLLYDKDGFIAVALGSIYGPIGTRYYFTLDSGIVLPLVKGEEKADVDTDYSGCYHTIDGSVIEFVINDDYAAKYFYSSGNGLVLNGNFNNYFLFSGSIVSVEKVLDEKIDNTLIYINNYIRPVEQDIFYYASGY